MPNKNFSEIFKRRLLLAASVGLLLSCLSVAIMSLWPLNNQLKEQQANRLVFTVKTKALMVDQFLEKAKETARQITSRSKARESLEKYNADLISLETLQDFSTPILKDALSLSDFAASICRLDIEMHPVVQVGLPMPENVLKQIDLTSDSAEITGPIMIGDDYFVVASTPIIDRQGDRVGRDIVLFNTSNLMEIVQDYTGLGITGETVLGRLNSDNHPEVFFAMRQTAESDHHTQKSQHFSIVEQAINKACLPPQKTTVHLLKTAGEIAVYSTIEDTDWAIVIRMDKSELFEVVSKQVLMVVLAIVFLVIPLGWIGLMLLLRPLSGKILIQVNTLQQEVTAKENAIQKQKMAEEQLLEEKEQLNVTLRSIGDGVITTDLDGRIVLLNKIAEQLTGWDQQTAVGRPLPEVFHNINERTGKPCENPVSKVLISQTIVDLENHSTLISKDGTQYSIEDSAAPIFNKSNEIVGTVLVFRDVTEKRKTSEELLKIKKLESVGVLAGGIAHDFNNILAVILGNIELAEMSLDSGEDIHPLLREAKKASIRAKDLTQQLLTFSKGGDPVKKTTPIEKVIIESANFVLHGSTVSCQFSIPNELWLVDIDPGQIGQVIQNLVINAKQAMPDGGQIKIGCSNIGDISTRHKLNLHNNTCIRITVQDFGVGIADKYIERIFDPYFTTKQTGSGLGLAISLSIINKHEGHIAVNSKPGEGTVFTIYLPASHSQTLPRDVAQSQNNDMPKSRILVMDDDKLVQSVASQMLAQLGHVVITAGDGLETVNIFREHFNSQHPFDIVIMDLTIPGGMGGKEAIIEVLKINPDVTAIVSSGYSNDPVMSNFRQYGFKAAIAKPFSMSELTRVLKTVLA